MAGRPHILLVDVPSEAHERLAARQYSVQRGTLGCKWRVDPAPDLLPVGLGEAHLPNRTEQDIIVVDFAADLQTGEPSITWPPQSESGFYQSMVRGIVDFRPRVATAVNHDWQRIYEHGGVFCVFADEPFPIGYVYGERLARGVQERDEVEMRLWDLVDPLGALRVASDAGGDIRATSAAEGLGVAEHLTGRFTCTVEAIGQQAQRWLPLATNRWGKCVAGLLLGEGDKGMIVVLPQIDDKASAVAWVVNDLAPRLRPKLFPDLEQGGWRREPELELVTVRELRGELAEVRRRAGEAEAALQARIDAARSEIDWLLDLLDGTDDVLVGAVARALSACGLKDVRNADAELAAADPGADRREDLQVHDRPQLLLVEVKGITRPRPQESEVLQVGKYLAPRMRSLGGRDVVGLTVINHERHLPPATRAAEVFGADVFAAAEDQHIGLIRAVDLYRLARGAVEYSWSPEVLRDRFWQPGVLDGRPEHHEPLGRIAHVFEEAKVIAVDLTATLRRGARIAVELPTHTVEIEADSLQQERRDVESAEAEEHVAIYVGEHVDELREGMDILVAHASRAVAAA